MKRRQPRAVKVTHDLSILPDPVFPPTNPSIHRSHIHPRPVSYIPGCNKSRDQSYSSSRLTPPQALLLTPTINVSTKVCKEGDKPDSGYVGGSDELAALKLKVTQFSTLQSKLNFSENMYKNTSRDSENESLSSGTLVDGWKSTESLHLPSISGHWQDTCMNTSSDSESESLSSVTLVDASESKESLYLPPITGYWHARSQQHDREELTTHEKKGRKKGSQSHKCHRKVPTASLSEILSWESEIRPLLRGLESASDMEIEHLRTLCDSLWVCLNRHLIIGRLGGCSGCTSKSTILTTVFKLLDHTDPLVLLKVAKIIIWVSTSVIFGNNLITNLEVPVFFLNVSFT